MTPEQQTAQNNANPRTLPLGCRRVRLGEACEIIAGQSPPGETYRKSPGGIPFFQGKADFGLHHPVARTWCIAPNKVARAGDILISVRAPVGPTNVADVECCIGRGLAAIRPREGIADRDFILSALNFYESHLARLGSGSTFQAINREHLESLTIPLPPLAEQRRIAASLCEQLAEVAKARSAVESQIDTAERVLATHLRSIFTKAETCNRWLKSLGDILKLRKDVIHPRNNPTGVATFVGLEHIESNTGRRIGSLTVNMGTLTGRKPQFFRGDIVYGYLRPYLNKVWVAEFDGLCSVDQYVYEVNRSLAETDFVAWFMRSPVYLERAPVAATPGWLPRIRTEEVASVEIGLPNLADQRGILETLRSAITDISTLRNRLFDRFAALEQMPATLLREVFRHGLHET